MSPAPLRIKQTCLAYVRGNRGQSGDLFHGLSAIGGRVLSRTLGLYDSASSLSKALVCITSSFAGASTFHQGRVSMQYVPVTSDKASSAFTSKMGHFLQAALRPTT